MRSDAVVGADLANSLGNRLEALLERAAARTVVFWSCLVVVVAAVVFVRTCLSFEFPVPWPDEAINLSQAFALETTGSLRVPALNPDRILMWMPFGYIVTTAAIFKAIGYSFDNARWISAVFFVGGYALWLLVVRQVLHGWRMLAATVFSTVVFLLPLVIVSANIARMESMFAFMAFASLLFCVRGRWLSGLSVVVAMSTVHFNAVYFLVPYILHAGYSISSRRFPVVARGEWMMAAAAAVAVGAYALFCLANLDGFLADMAFQFSRKAGRSFAGLEARIVVLGLMLCVPVAQLAIRRRFTPAVFVSLYGISFFLMPLYGREMWYLFGYPVGVLLIIVALATEVPSGGSGLRRLGPSAMMGVFGLCALRYGYNTYLLVEPLPRLVSDHIISSEDRARISSFIRGLPPGTTVSFAFNFNGIEPFFFEDFAHSGARWRTQAHSATQFEPMQSVDYRVRCDSHLYRPLMDMISDGEFPRQGRDTGCEIFKWEK